MFLSDPGPIIVYPCQWLTHSLTYSLKNLLKIEWVDLNMQTMQTLQTMQNMQNMQNMQIEGNNFFSLIDIMVIYYGGSIIILDT